MAEPIELDDIKVHLALELDDTSEDSYLSSLIIAARRACELRTRQTIVGEERTLVLACFPGSEPLELIWSASASLAVDPEGADDVALTGGSVSTAAVRYYDGEGTDTLLDEATYFAAFDVHPAILRPLTSWPSTQDRPDAVRITYTVSPMSAGDLEMIKHAMRLLIGHWYVNREPVAGMPGQVPELPLAVSWLLEPLRKFAIT